MKRNSLFPAGIRRKWRIPALLLLLPALLALAGYRQTHVGSFLEQIFAQARTDHRPIQQSDGRHNSGGSPQNTPTEPFKARCVGVKDGDTVAVLTEQQREITVRLFGIDAPEKKQPYGERARQFLSDIIFGKTVQVVPRNRDRYGQLVADILLEDNRRVNELVVQAGMAWWYRTYAPNDTVLRQLEQQAKNAKTGLWKDPNPIPPWEFRRSGKKH
ncbi:MAG TPA: thermonuclease family protein [Candidatus Hydrogenedentes bacterium]|nr:thermonuclease family protein [Candidatus Hydrogenedentota bacterium]